MNTEYLNKGGLLPLPPDERDFSHSKVFGTLKPQELPFEDFIVAEPIRIKDQGDSDKCGAYAGCAVSEDQEEVELNPHYQFAKIKQIMGDPEGWGADLRSVCKSFTDYGSIQNAAGYPESRDWKDWGPEYDFMAIPHKKKTYFSVDGPYDTFDNMRMTLWQNRNESRSILTGCLWRNEWTNANHGVIDDLNYIKTGYGHALKIYGQETIDDELYLTAQLSNGIGIGDEGIFYLPRSIVNNEFTYGAFTFKDMPKETAEYYIDHGINTRQNWAIQFLTIIKNLFK